MAEDYLNIRSYYDEFHRRLLLDYCHGNIRAETAIRRVQSCIRSDFKSMLELGCGIGWCSWEIKRRHPQLNIYAADISAQAIKTASRLFESDQLWFCVTDIFHDLPYKSGSFDLIALCDVYEHVPQAYRKRLHTNLKRLLSPSGRVCLTFPSIAHQDYLRRECPSGLQPVDENIDRPVIEALSDELGTRIIVYDEVSNFQSRDYVHVVLGRDVGSLDVPDGKADVIEPLEACRRRVYERLNVRVTKGGTFVSRRVPAQRLVVICGNDPGPSETFIRAHIERLQFDMRAVFCHNGLCLDEYGHDLIPAIRLSLRSRVLRRLRLSHLHIPSPTDRLATALKQTGATVAMAEYGTTGTVVMNACKAAAIPLVVHFHGYDASVRTVVAKRIGGYRQLFIQAKALVVVSDAMRKRMIAMGAPEGKLHVVPYGIDLDKFRPATGKLGPPVFLAVGRFVEKKAPHLTLLAFSKILHHLPEARLEMVGEGVLFGPCKNLAVALGIAHNVTFLGLLSHSEVIARMKRAHVFVQHSVKAVDGDSEGTPVAILEAAACGLPVVSTRHEGIVEAVSDGKTGILVDEGDVDAMAAAMLSLARDTALHAMMGEAARQHIERYYSMQEQMKRLEHLLIAAIG